MIPLPVSSAPQRLALPFLQSRTPFQTMKKADVRQKRPKLVVLTCSRPFGNCSLPRGVYFSLAVSCCTGWFGAACQVPLAQAKTVPRICWVPMLPAGCQSGQLWKRQEIGGKIRRSTQERLPHRNARTVTWKHTLGHKRWSTHSTHWWLIKAAPV